MRPRALRAAALCLFAVSNAGAEPPRKRAGDAPEAAASGVAEWRLRGTVLETLGASGYTYVRIDTGEETVWVAAPETEVSVGDTVLLPDASATLDFYSRALERSFDIVYFASFMRVAGREEPAPVSAPSEAPLSPCDPGEAAEGEIDVASVERAEGGYTVAEVLDGSVSLEGRPVTLRGRVVKVACRVLGRNWIHLRDGSTGSRGERELVLTTSGAAHVGATVLVTGTVAADRDFGSGYRYDLLIEEATVTVE